jgi:transcriptional regulator with XRE-family HTH domain
LQVRRGGVRLGGAKAAIAGAGAETGGAPLPETAPAGACFVPNLQPVDRETPQADVDATLATAGAQPLAGASAPLPDTGQATVVKLGETVLSLGQVLAEARGARNLTVSQVAQKTRVPKDIIEHIESDQIDQLPSPIYTRAHLVHLCEEYEVDKDTVLHDYDRLVAALPATASGELDGIVMTSKTTESASRVQWRPAGRGPPGERRRPLSPTMWLVAAAAVLIVVLAMVALSVQQWRRRQALSPGSEAGAGTETPVRTVNLDDYVGPQQLPLKDLAIPKK